MLPVSARICARFLIGVALSKEFLENCARVAFLRERLSRRAPCEAGAALRGGEFQGRQTRILSNVPDRQLVGADTEVCTALAEIPGFHAGEPSLLDVGMRLGRFRGLIAQAGDDRDMLTERRERLQDRRHGEVRAGFLRRPAIHDRAMRESHEGEAFRRLAGGGVGPGRGGGNHGVQERQCDGGPDSLQDRAALNGFLVINMVRLLASIILPELDLDWGTFPQSRHRGRAAISSRV